MSECTSKPSSSDDSDPDRKGFQQSFIRGLARAVTRDMEETLHMVPGGELNEQSIKFMRQSAQAVIQQQCELLYDPRKQIHKDICCRIVNEVRKLTAKFKQNLDWDEFSNELGDLMEKAVDALDDNNKRSLSSKSSDSSSSKSSTQKHKKTQPEQQRRPAGPDERAFGAG